MNLAERDDLDKGEENFCPGPTLRWRQHIFNVVSTVRRCAPFGMKRRTAETSRFDTAQLVPDNPFALSLQDRVVTGILFPRDDGGQPLTCLRQVVSMAGILHSRESPVNPLQHGFGNPQGFVLPFVRRSLVPKHQDSRFVAE